MATPADRGYRLACAGVLTALLAAVAVLTGSGCNAARSFKDRATRATAQFLGTSYNDPHAEQKLADAELLYAQGKYQEALKVFRALADNQGNTAVVAERARFMQAECRYHLRQFPEACDTYHKVLVDFPTGAYRRDACARMYEICDYWLNDFRNELDRRAAKGESGVLRWRPQWPDFRDPTRPKIDQEGRTLEALQRIHTHDMTGPTADKALFWCGYINYVRGNFKEAEQFFSQFVELHSDSELLPQAQILAIQAKNNSTGGAEYDGRKCAEALQLVMTAEASMPELMNDPAMAEKLARARIAIRSQQAEKDFKMAEYYERTGHPGSAVFYYELVRRRYAGTPYASLATARQDRLLKLMQEGRPDPGNDPIAILKAKWSELFDPRRSPDDKDRARLDPNVMPAGGTPIPPVGGRP